MVQLLPRLTGGAEDQQVTSGRRKGDEGRRDKLSCIGIKSIAMLMTRNHPVSS